MITPKEIAREQRLQNSYERLDSDDPRCVVCQEANPHCLERHHLAGRKNDDDTVLVCRNCHRKLSDKQRDHPQSKGAPPTLLEIAGYFMLHLADLFELLIEKFTEFGNALIDMARVDSRIDAEASQ